MCKIVIAYRGISGTSMCVVYMNVQYPIPEAHANCAFEQYSL